MSYFFSGSNGVTPVHDFYIQPPSAAPVPPFHPNSFLAGSLPPFVQDLTKPPNFAVGLRPAMPNPLDQLSLRVSPICNSQGSSPQPQSLLNAQETRIHSTMDQSSASEHSDDEDIDVVKSAFMPIKPANVLLQEIQQPDSTVQEPTKVKCELKAPSSRTIKSLAVSPETNTKIRGSSIASTNKSVWRPY